MGTLTHEDVEPRFLRGASSVRELFKKLKALEDDEVLHHGSSALDELIRGLLTVDVRTRLTSDEAIEKAKLWAEEEGLTRNEIRSIIRAKRDGNFERDELPASWNKCIEKNCFSTGYECI